MKRLSRLLIVRLLAILLAVGATAPLTGCHTSRPAAPAWQKQKPKKHKKAKKAKKGKHKGSPGPSAKPTRPRKVSSREAEALLKEAEGWIGVPYVYGGEDRSGVDCSGFVMNVYRDVLGVKLPRNSEKQSQWCPKQVKKMADLEAGDLVFFDTSGSRNGRVSHVGIYMGDGTMIHSSVSRGVVCTSIEQDYFAQRFLQGGRVIAATAAKADKKAPKQEPQPAPAPVAEPAQPAVEAAPGPPAVIKAEPASPLPSPEAPKAVADARAATASPADARAAVLGNLIEQKLDSIYVNDSRP